MSTQVEVDPKENPNNSSDYERPEWLPEKFKSPEEMAKAYQELEKKMGAEGPKASGPDGQETSGEGEEVTGEGEGDGQEGKGEDNEEENQDNRYQKFIDEFKNNGELSEDSYKELSEQYGITREMVDTYIQGETAGAQQYLSKIHEVTGGEENYKSMVEWASENLSKEEIEAFDSTMDTNNPAQIAMAVRGLWAQYQQANGKAPQRQVKGKPSSKGGGVPGFTSNHEMQKAMSDQRYKDGDPKFHAWVDKMIAEGTRKGQL